MPGEDWKLYEQAKAEGLNVYTPEQFFYYYSGPNAPKGHPFTGMSYAEYIQYVRQSEAVKALTAARLQRWQQEGCARELPHEVELRERAQQISQERGIPYDTAMVEAYRQLESEGLFRTKPGGAVEVRPYVELQLQGGHKIVPVPENVTEPDFAKWVYETMKQHGATTAWVGSQRVTFEQLKNVFEPPQPPPQPQPEQKFYVEVMRGYGPSEKMEIIPFEEFKKQYPQYGEREYMLYLFKTAREKGYEQILTQQGWIKIPEKFEVTGMEIFTPEGIKMVSPKVFSEFVESSLKSTTVGTGDFTAAIAKGFGVGILRGISLGAAERIVPSIAAKPPATIQAFLPPVQPARSTAVDFTLQAETPEQKRAREAYFVHEMAAIPGTLVGSLMLSKAIETVAKLPPAEEIARRYAAGERVTPLERIKLEAWIHTPEKVWRGLQKIGDALTVRETRYEIPRDVEVRVAQLRGPQERLTYFSTKIKSWQEVTPELAEHLQKMSEPFGFIPVNVGGRTVKVPWHEKGATYLHAGAERYLMVGTGEQAYGLGLYPTNIFTEPGAAVTKLSGIVDVKTVESLTLGGTPKLLAAPRVAAAPGSFSLAPSVPVKVSTAVKSLPVLPLAPPAVKPEVEAAVGVDAKAVPKVEPKIEPLEVKIPVKVEVEERRTPPPLAPPSPVSIPVKARERAGSEPLSVPMLGQEVREEPVVTTAVGSRVRVADVPRVAAVPAVSAAATTAVAQRLEQALRMAERTVEPGRGLPKLPEPRLPPLTLPRGGGAAAHRARGLGWEHWTVDWFRAFSGTVFKEVFGGGGRKRGRG
ncbi:MAG: hypothetical protein QXQ60_09345, partial [Thermofilum sp.]